MEKTLILYLLFLLFKKKGSLVTVARERENKRIFCFRYQKYERISED